VARKPRTCAETSLLLEKHQIAWDRIAVGPEIRIWEWRQQGDVKVSNAKVADLGKTKKKYWMR
jgi:hypothetical protein